ncbi:YXWGXW repeat-containing protein [Kozakia baliensis]|uniref:YXWGXW repeat-containing protein n=1 Tax=Kozakia baliensis TaxID=153496 RepID=UPI00345BD8BA
MKKTFLALCLGLTVVGAVVTPTAQAQQMGPGPNYDRGSYGPNAYGPDSRGRGDRGGPGGPGYMGNRPPPPPLRMERVPPPRRNWIWTRGYWRWEPRGYVWVPGHWVRPRWDRQYRY